ncbi:MAG TPA: TolC family protein, partial [Lysobacter sp.]|nr:TolC family protein [Lysobacter sp.]
MRSHLAAAAACVAAWLAVVPASAADRLSLDDAFRRVESLHPDLRLGAGQRRVLDAELDRAGLRPPRVVGAEAENLLGTGEARGLSGAELTLTLASVLERGDKADARRAL